MLLQVMYMYYLLSYRLFGKESKAILEELQAKRTNEEEENGKKNGKSDSKKSSTTEKLETSSLNRPSRVGHYGTIFKHIQQHMIEKVPRPIGCKTWKIGHVTLAEITGTTGVLSLQLIWWSDTRGFLVVSGACSACLIFKWDAATRSY